MIIKIVCFCFLLSLLSSWRILSWCVRLRYVVGLFSSSSFVFCVSVMVIYMCWCCLFDSVLIGCLVNLVMFVFLSVYLIIWWFLLFNLLNFDWCGNLLYDINLYIVKLFGVLGVCGRIVIFFVMFFVDILWIVLLFK